MRTERGDLVLRLLPMLASFDGGGVKSNGVDLVGSGCEGHAIDVVIGSPGRSPGVVR